MGPLYRSIHPLAQWPRAQEVGRGFTATDTRNGAIEPATHVYTREAGLGCQGIWVVRRSEIYGFGSAEADACFDPAAG